METQKVTLPKFKLPGPYKTEKEFQAALHRAFKGSGMFVYRIPDLGPAYRNFDSVVFGDNGNVWCCEYKIVDGMTLNENKLEDSQHNSFAMLEGLSHECLVIVWSKKANDYAQFTYSDMMLGIDSKGSFKLTHRF